MPEVTKNCAASCDIETTTCVVDPCTCKTIGDTCSINFSPSCDYESNSLYTCSAIEATPEKKQACQDTEVCVPVSGGGDICGPSSCDCTGTGPVCGSGFPPSCNKTVNSVITCPGGTETPCPNGCANGLCQNGCTCTDDSSMCGSSFGPSCNLLPNAIYTCKSGQTPELDDDCGDATCVTSPIATCQDPCLCKDDQKVVLASVYTD